MRVFYIRASDNGNYGIAAALAAPGSRVTRLDVALYRGPRVPLLPLNYTADERGLTDLNAYEVVILAGVDPVVLSSADSLALVAYVERGGGLLLVGGNHSFANAEGTYLPLAPILPVRILRGLDVQVNAAPRLKPHPVTQGLPEPLGYVSKVHDVAIKDGAEVVMTASDFPLAVVGEYEYGRVVVLASYPECQESEYGWFFTGDAFDDFLRNALDWVTKTHRSVFVESFALTKRVLAPGEEAFGAVFLRAATPATVRLTTVLTHASGREIARNESLLRIPESLETLVSVRPPEPCGATGLHYVTVVVTDQDGNETARRDVALEVVPPDHVEVEVEHGRPLLAAGKPLRVRLRAIRAKRPAGSRTLVRASLLDESGTVLAQASGRPKTWKGSRSEGVDLELSPPRLRPSPYRLCGELLVSDRVVHAVERPLHVIADRPAEQTFPLIAEGAHGLDRESVDTGLAMLRACGANVLSFPGPVVEPWEPRSHTEAMLAYAEEKAVLAGLSLAHHRRGLLSGLNPAVPLVPCPLSKGFRAVADAYAKPVIEAAAHAPRLLFHEIAPHTAVRPSQHCGCEACQAAFVRAYRQALPKAPLDKLGLATHRNVCSFLASTWWHAYERVVELRDAADGPPLSLPFDAASFVRQGRQDPFCDVETWNRASDVVEVAPERDLRLWRLSLGGHRALCAAREKDFGAVLDLAVGSPPPAEAAWTAIANGAAHLRIAGNPRFLFWDRQAPIDVALGDTFRRIGRIGSLLAHARRPKARLALLLPSTQIVDGDGGRVLSAFDLLYRGFGDVDILHQRLLDDHLGDHDALALLGAHVLPRRTVRALVRFVEQGGVLIAESGELLDETGAPVVWPDGFLGTAETPVFEHIACRRRAFGSGRTVCFTASVVAAFERALTEDDAIAASLLARCIADEVAQRGIRPHARSSHPEVEAGLLDCGGSHLLIAVNHSDREQVADIAVESDATVAFDLFSGAERDVGDTVRVALPARDGSAWLLAAERPFGVRVEALDSAEARAGFRINVLAGSGAPATGAWPLRVTVTDPEGRERPELGGRLVALDGSLTLDWPLAANDPPGAWTVAACDVFTRRMSRTTLHVAPTSPTADGEAS